MQNKQISFGPFRFDEINECLWRGTQAIPLRPKPFSVLKYLLEHQGVLVTKQQLLHDVWPGTYVSDSVLKDCIRQLRHALNDDAKSPQFIETSHRRGYRFVAPVVADNAPETVASTYPPSLPAPTMILGREQALSQLQQWLEQTLAGNTRIVFVTGEAGIGKTTVVEAFLKGINANVCI